MIFELHPRLAAGTIKLGQYHNCQILLKNNSHYAWLLIVPEVESTIIDLHQLDSTTYQYICDLQLKLAHFIQAQFNCYKLNTACIGNVVEQLHIHVVGRNIDTTYQQGNDPAWPAPIWGHPAKQAYTEEQIIAIQQAFSELTLES